MKIKSLIAIVAIGATLASCTGGGTSTNLETVKDSTSYALGALQAEGMMKQMESMKVAQHIDADWMLKGVKARIDEKSLIDNEQARKVITGVFMGLRQDSTFSLPAASNDGVMTNVADSLSYALGAQIIEGITRGAADLKVAENIDNSKVYDAIKDVMTDSSKIDFNTGRRLIDAMVADARKKQEEVQAKEAETQGEEGKAFLNKNKEREGIIVTESGLQYEVLKKGTGNQPKATDKVNVHYHGTLIDGTVFDSSVDRGEPISFGLNQVIKGWTEGVQLMKEGAKYKFYIPQELGYGARATGKIPAYATLIFEVELIKIEK